MEGAAMSPAHDRHPSPSAPTLGVIGGGQLARMMIPAAVNLGLHIAVLAEQPGMSAALAEAAVGDYHDIDSVLAFARSMDAVTFDHEHVPQQVLRALIDAGVAVHPGPDALRFAQDKLLMRERLAELGMPVPGWARVRSAGELGDFLAEYGPRVVVKTPRGGYDGKGVRVVGEQHGADDWFLALAEDGRGGELLVEELVDFRRELAQLVARRPSGEIAVWPLVQTVQTDGVCTEVIAPAPGLREKEFEVAARIGREIAEKLDVTGVLAVELFETTDDRLLVNELAMRPHNSGHWTIDGAVTSQFEQHIRAVLDLPLGGTEPRADWSVMVNILGGPEEGMPARYASTLAAHPGVKVHCYGKEFRAGRKVGHVTATGTDLDDVSYDARAAAARFATGPAAPTG